MTEPTHEITLPDACKPFERDQYPQHGYTDVRGTIRGWWPTPAEAAAAAHLQPGVEQADAGRAGTEVQRPEEEEQSKARPSDTGPEVLAGIGEVLPDLRRLLGLSLERLTRVERTDREHLEAAQRMEPRVTILDQGFEVVEVLGRQSHVGRVRWTAEAGLDWLEVDVAEHVAERHVWPRQVVRIAPRSIFRRTKIQEVDVAGLAHLQSHTDPSVGRPLPGLRVEKAREALEAYVSMATAAHALGLGFEEYRRIELCETPIDDGRADALIAALESAAPGLVDRESDLETRNGRLAKRIEALEEEKTKMCRMLGVAAFELALDLHESGRTPVAAGETLAATVVGRRGFVEWEELPDSVRVGRLVTATLLLERFSVVTAPVGEHRQEDAIAGVDRETLAAAIHEAERTAVEAGLVLNRIDRPWLTFAELPEAAATGRRRQADHLMLGRTWSPKL